MAKPTETPAPIEAGLNSRVPFYVLALIVLVFAIVRVRTMNIPLERDEGEYAYAGQLLLQGIPPYKLAFNMKLPGTYLAYALIMAVFGQTGAGIHAGLLVVNSVSIILVFLLTRRLLDSLAALVASASYAILSAGPSVLGFAGHATHFLVLAGLAGILLLLRAMEKRRAWELVLSGVLLGLAFLMKQPGLFLIFFGFLYLVKTQFSDRVGWRTLFLQCSAFLAGAALPFLLTCLWLEGRRLWTILVLDLHLRAPLRNHGQPSRCVWHISHEQSCGNPPRGWNLDHCGRRFGRPLVEKEFFSAVPYRIS